ncbi:hypothetical protein C8J56DRAFT_1177162 [Mycena floridula]|nr:hypothetical protein C8J56DRAFT_1177162 [Mycena floridula]
MQKRVSRHTIPVLGQQAVSQNLLSLAHLKDTYSANPNFTRCVRTLDIDTDPYQPLIPCEILLQILSSLPSLCQLDLHYLKIDSQLLSLINSHPALVTVATNTVFADLPCDLSLSKIVLKSAEGYTMPLPPLAQSRGCGIYRLWALYKVKGFETVTFHRLRELQINLAAEAVPWLSAFVARHPNLVSISFEDPYRNMDQISSTIASYVSPFLEEAERLGIADCAGITDVTISRPAIDSAFDSWTVTGINLTMRDDSIFSSVTSLQLVSNDIDFGSELIPINVLTQALSHFRSLRALDLRLLYRQLDLGDQMPSPKDTDHYHDYAATEAAIHWLVQHLAHVLPTLGLIIITEPGEYRMLETIYTSVRRRSLLNGETEVNLTNVGAALSQKSNYWD